MPPEQQAGAIAFTTLMLLMAFPLLFREWRTFGIIRSDPREMRAAFQHYRLSWVTGVIQNYRSAVHSETTTTTTHHSDGTSETTRSTTSTRYESFDIVTEDSVHNASIPSSYLNLANGNVVTGVWATRKRKNTSQWVLFCDQTTFGWAFLLVLFSAIASRRARKFARRDGPRILAAARAEQIAR